MKAIARGDVPKTLHNIAFVSIPNSADLEFLLWDLQDAIVTYAQLSGTSLPRLIDLEADDAGAVDGMVLAVDDAFDDEAMIAVEQILDRLGNTETRIYVVVQAASKNNKQADELLDRLYRACILRDLPWCGGVVICAGSDIAVLRHSPRMGLLRRPFSEAIDMLVGAVRMGCSVVHAQRLGGGNAANVDADGMVCAEPAVPAPIWRGVLKRLGTRAQSDI